MKRSELAHQLSLSAAQVDALINQLASEGAQIDTLADNIPDALAQALIAQKQQQKPALNQQETAPEPTSKTKRTRGGKLAKNASELEQTSQNQSIASIKQQQLSSSIQAETEQFNHQAQTRLQQSFADGQELGVLEVLAREQGRLNASLAVSQVIFEGDMKRREAALANLAEKLEGEDFFGEQQSPAESYWKSSQVGASSNWELNQILQNLANI